MSDENTERASLQDAIDDVCDWLDFDALPAGPIRDSIKRLNHARIAALQDRQQREATSAPGGVNAEGAPELPSLPDYFIRYHGTDLYTADHMQAHAAQAWSDGYTSGRSIAARRVAALAANPVSDAQDGREAEPVGAWKLVPVEPTRAMLDAGRDSVSLFDYEAGVRKGWADMLNAAPLPEPPAARSKP